MRSPNALPLAATGVAAAVLLSGCGGSAEPLTAEEYAYQCSQDNRRELPTSTNVTEIVDDRTGPVFACEYLIDLGLPVNEPTELLKTDEQLVQSSSFKIKGDIGGLAVLGTGLLSGSLEGSGATDHRNLTVLTFLDADGAIRTIGIDSETNADKVRVVPCADECEPTVTFETSDEPLWDKDGGWDGMPPCLKSNNASIWLVENRADNTNCQRVISQVSTRLPQEKTDFFYSGGPAPTGQVVAALTTQVTLNLPPSLIEK